MRIIFAGTPEFAVPILEALLASEHQLIAVYTQPDRPAGRGQKLTASPVKQLAQTHGLPVFQPVTLRDYQEQQHLRDLKPDLMIVVAYGLILPAPVLAIPLFGCVNVHPSLLPRWRGAAPIQRAIQCGDTTTGVTIMQMEEGLDSGPMLLKQECAIEKTDTALSLQHKLANLSQEALLAALAEIATGTAKPQIQDAAQACYAKKIDKMEALINWLDDAEKIDRQVRAFNPWPVAFTHLQDQVIKIWQAHPLAGKHHHAPGEIIKADKEGIDVATGNGILRLLQIQIPGSRCLPVGEVLHAKAAWFAPGVKFKF